MGNSDSDSETSSSLSTDSSSSEIDNIQKDPTYKCYVKNVAPSTVKKRLRTGISKSRSLGIFPVGSGAIPKGKTKRKITLPKLQEAVVKMTTPPGSPPPISGPTTGQPLGAGPPGSGGVGVLDDVR